MPNTFFDDKPNEPSEDHEQLGPDFFSTDRPEAGGQLHFFYIDENGDWEPYASFEFRADVERDNHGIPLVIVEDGETFVVNKHTGELLPVKIWDEGFDYYDIVSQMFDDIGEYDAIMSGQIGYSIT